MPRAPFQVVVLPFRSGVDGVPQYCVMRRADQGYWQFVAGGGEDDESPEQAARREAVEEAGFPYTASLYRLQSMDTVPVISFQDRAHWPPDLYVVPQHAFAISAGSHEIVLSPEHTEARWARYETVSAQLWWQSNQTALWELHERLRHHDLPAPLREGYPR